MSMETLAWRVFGWSDMVVFFVNLFFLMGLCVDLLHICTLHVWTSSTQTPPCVDYLHTRPFFVCRFTTDVGMKFGRFGLHVEGMLTEFRTNLVYI